MSVLLLAAWYWLGVGLLLLYARLGLLVLLALLASRFLSDRGRLAWPPGWPWLAGSILAGAVVVAAAQDTRLALAAAWWGLLYLLAWWWLTARPRPVALTPARLCWATVPALALLLIELFANRQPRPVGVFGNPNITAVVVAAALPCGLHVWRARWAEGVLSVGATLWLAAALAALAASASVGGWLAAAVGVLVYFALAGGWRLSTWLSLAALLFLAGLTVTLRPPRLLYESAVTRLEGWRVAWAIFQEQPLTGLGPRGYGLAYLERTTLGPEYPTLPHAHNGLMQILAEGGLAGLAAAAAVGGVVIARLKSAKPERQAVAGAALAALAAGQLIDYTLWVPAVALLGLALAALAEPASYGGGLLYRPRPGRAAPSTRAVFVVVLAVLIGAGLAVERAEIPSAAAARAASAGEWERAAEYYHMAAKLDPALPVYQNAAAAALAGPPSPPRGQIAIDRVVYRRSVIYPGGE